jgi:ribonuclease HI
MAEVWNLPDERTLKPTGANWLFHFLHAISETQHAMTLIIFWRVWHAHNEITHAKPCPPIEGSRRFLVSYLNTLLMLKQFPHADVAKGKMVIDPNQGFKRAERRHDVSKQPCHAWRPPDGDMAKLNVNGAFSPDGRAGCGMILRNQQGEVIFAACQQVQHCRDATEAEIMTIEEGLKLALLWTQQRFSVESDCSTAIDLIGCASTNISEYAFRISTIRGLLRERDSRLVKINRVANRASHELAQLARVQGRTNVWIRESPPEIDAVLNTDCNPMSV